MKLFCLSFAILVACHLSVQAETVKSSTAPWDLAKLSVVPAFEWVKSDGPVRSLIYTGESFKGQPSKVFAYYASPATLNGTTPAASQKYPGIVLIHGGGGTAFPQWAELWAKRGYAAIAMDLSGCRSDQLDEKKKPVRMVDGGPDQGHPAKFETIGTEDTSDDWSYHAVASSVLAHSLLRSFPEVDAEHTAVTGISWGGYTTCIVASVDHRFKAAVPVYGCGFLHENSAWLGEFAKLGPEKTKRWVELYDPSSRLPKCRVPIFFVNGTNDFAYWLNSYMKSYDAVTLVPKNIRLEVKMPHGHEVGWKPNEIGWYVDSILGVNGETPLPVCGEPQRNGDKVTATVQSALTIKRAVLNYAKPGEAINKREWVVVPAEIEKGVITAPAPPADSDMWFFNVTDERGAMVSSVMKIIAK